MKNIIDITVNNNLVQELDNSFHEIEKTGLIVTKIFLNKSTLEKLDKNKDMLELLLREKGYISLWSADLTIKKSVPENKLILVGEEPDDCNPETI